MKKFLALAMALAMTFALAACGEDAGGGAAASGSASASGSNPVLKVGVFEPASGDNGAGGKQEVLGIQYANQVVPTVDIGGQTYDIQLEIVDNQSTTDKAITAASTGPFWWIIAGAVPWKVALAALAYVRHCRCPHSSRDQAVFPAIG